VPESILYPREYNATNVGGTVALMEAMRDAGVKRVVLASSAAIYGEQPEAHVTEDLPPKPTSPYGVSKLSAEYYVSSIGQLWGIETVILRIFNAYGPDQHLPPAHPPVIPQFMHQALWEGSLMVHGNGSQIRDFVYIDDIVSGLVAAATATGINGHIINIGSGVGTSINDLINVISTVTDSKLQVLHVNTESRGVSRLVANIGLAQELLDYHPPTPLQEGLAQLLAQDTRFQQVKRKS
jgi:UDP-glucose 4-epimerase